MNTALDKSRQDIHAVRHKGEPARIHALLRDWQPDAAVQNETQRRALGLVKKIREQKSPNLLEAFLAEYGLSTDEGVGMMCLAEALLRVPDSPTIDALIEDKIVPLLAGPSDIVQLVLERHVCIDTTASGGNTTLLMQTA